MSLKGQNGVFHLILNTLNIQRNTPSGQQTPCVGRDSGNSHQHYSHTKWANTKFFLRVSTPINTQKKEESEEAKPTLHHKMQSLNPPDDLPCTLTYISLWSKRFLRLLMTVSSLRGSKRTISPTPIILSSSDVFTSILAIVSCCRKERERNNLNEQDWFRWVLGTNEEMKHC